MAQNTTNKLEQRPPNSNYLLMQNKSDARNRVKAHSAKKNFKEPDLPINN